MRNYPGQVKLANGVLVRDIDRGPAGNVPGSNPGDLLLRDTTGQEESWTNRQGQFSLVFETGGRLSAGRAADPSSLTIIPAGGSVTVPIPVPVDGTIKQLLLFGLGGEAFDEDVASLFVSVDLIETTAGLDAGTNLVLGDATGAMFSLDKPLPFSMAELNLRASAGALINVRLNNASPIDLWCTPQLTYAPGVDPNTGPNFILGLTTPSVVVPVGSAASNTLTINTAPLAAGDEINARPLVIAEDFVLTGVAGARTPGANDFDASLGTIGALRTEILAALNDPLNEFADTYTASAGVGAGDVVLTRNLGGLIGNLDILTATTTPGGGITVASLHFTGGTAGAPTALTFTAPGVDRLAHRLILSGNNALGRSGLEQYVRVTSIAGLASGPLSGEVMGQVFSPSYNGLPFDLDQVVAAASNVVVTVENIGFDPLFLFGGLSTRPVNA